MELHALVQKYLEVAGGFGKEAPLGSLGLAPSELETLFSNWEDDYQFSRHFELIPTSWMTPDLPQYRINGVLYRGVVFQETIRDVLA